MPHEPGWSGVRQEIIKAAPPEPSLRREASATSCPGGSTSTAFTSSNGNEHVLKGLIYRGHTIGVPRPHLPPRHETARRVGYPEPGDRGPREAPFVDGGELRCIPGEHRAG